MLFLLLLQHYAHRGMMSEENMGKDCLIHQPRDTPESWYAKGNQFDQRKVDVLIPRAGPIAQKDLYPIFLHRPKQNAVQTTSAKL